MSYRRNNKRVPKFHYYSNVKKTFEDHLVDLLKEPFYRRIKEICDSVKNKTKGNAKILKAFQHEMGSIKKWDYDELKSSAKSVINKSKASYVPKLIRGVIISNIKLLSATRSRKKLPNDIEIQVPEPINFFHKCFIEIGRGFYTEPYLICDQGQQPGLRLQNINDSIDLIEKAIKRTINMFLPFDTILDAYLANVDEDSDSEDEQEPEQSDNESEISDSESEESDVESINDSDDEQIGGDGLPDDDEDSEHSDVESVHSDGESVHSDGEIIENDFTNDEKITVEDDTQSIGDDIAEEFNFIPMRSDSNSDNEAPSQKEAPTSAPAKEEIKVVQVTKPSSASAAAPPSKGIVFYDDAEDL